MAAPYAFGNTALPSPAEIFGSTMLPNPSLLPSVPKLPAIPSSGTYWDPATGTMHIAVPGVNVPTGSTVSPFVSQKAFYDLATGTWHTAVPGVNIPGGSRTGVGQVMPIPQFAGGNVLIDPAAIRAGIASRSTDFGIAHRDYSNVAAPTTGKKGKITGKAGGSGIYDPLTDPYYKQAIAEINKGTPLYNPMLPSPTLAHPEYPAYSDFYATPQGKADVAAYNRATSSVYNTLQQYNQKLGALNAAISNPKQLAKLRNQARAEASYEVNQAVKGYRASQAQYRAQGARQYQLITAAANAAGQLQRSIGGDVAGSYNTAAQTLNALAGGVAGTAGAATMADVNRLANLTGTNNIPVVGAGGLNLATTPANLTQALTQMQGEVPAASMIRQGPLARDQAEQLGAAISGAGMQQGRAAMGAMEQQAQNLEPNIAQAYGQLPTLFRQIYGDFSTQRNQAFQTQIQLAQAQGQISTQQAQLALTAANNALTRDLNATNARNNRAAADAAITNAWNQASYSGALSMRGQDLSAYTQAYQAAVSARSQRISDLFKIASYRLSAQVAMAKALGVNGVKPLSAAQRAMYGQRLGNDLTQWSGKGGEENWSIKTNAAGAATGMTLKNPPIPIEEAWRRMLSKYGSLVAAAPDVALDQIRAAYGVPNWTWQEVASGIGPIPGGGGLVGPLPINPEFTLNGQVIRFRKGTAAGVAQNDHDPDWSQKIWDRQAGTWFGTTGASYQDPGGQLYPDAGPTASTTAYRTGGDANLMSYKMIPTTGPTDALNPSFLSKVYAAGNALGATQLVITSGKRSNPEHPGGPPNGGAANSNHLYGRAIDGYLVINNKRVPIGTALAPIASDYGLRSGASFDWQGSPDTMHVDDAYNQPSGPLPIPGQGGAQLVSQRSAPLTYQQLQQLWVQAGGLPAYAPLMAGIALAESGGRPTALNNNPNTGDYSSGLWQINYYGGMMDPRTQRYGSPQQVQDPLANARAAVDLFQGGQGLGNWRGDRAYNAYQQGGMGGLQSWLRGSRFV